MKLKQIHIRMPWNWLPPKKSLNNLLFKKKALKIKVCIHTKMNKTYIINIIHLILATF